MSDFEALGCAEMAQTFLDLIEWAVIWKDEPDTAKPPPLLLRDKLVSIGLKHYKKDLCIKVDVEKLEDHPIEKPWSRDREERRETWDNIVHLRDVNHMSFAKIGERLCIDATCARKVYKQRKKELEKKGGNDGTTK